MNKQTELQFEILPCCNGETTAIIEYKVISTNSSFNNAWYYGTFIECERFIKDWYKDKGY